MISNLRAGKNSSGGRGFRRHSEPGTVLDILMKEVHADLIRIAHGTVDVGFVIRVGLGKHIVCEFQKIHVLRQWLTITQNGARSIGCFQCISLAIFQG